MHTKFSKEKNIPNNFPITETLLSRADVGPIDDVTHRRDFRVISFGNKTKIFVIKLGNNLIKFFSTARGINRFVFVTMVYVFNPF